MIEVLAIDLCAILLAPELKAKLVLSQADKDGLYIACVGHIPRQHFRRALRIKGYLQSFDSLLYEEALLRLTAGELRTLANEKLTLWLRTPEDIDYVKVLPHLSPRQRMLPRALRMRIDQPSTFDEDAITPDD
jgi:hypothetical protein